jgi:endonuclease/exonuclease/phosphatase family metal-dependent hydrolase
MRHIHVRVAAVAAMLAPLATYAVQAPAEAATTASTTASTTVRVATYNVQVRRSLDQFLGGVGALLPRSDIVGLQEMDSREKEAALNGFDGWAHYSERPAFQQTILWRTDRFQLVGARVAKISDPMYIGRELPGKPANQPARYASVVRLLDTVTGHRVSVIDAHVIQGAVRGGRPWVGRPRVWRMFKQNMVNLAAVTATEKRWGQVFTLGDFNSGWVPDRKHLRKRMPIRTFGRLGMWSMWRYSRPTNGLGTHDDDLIDQVFSSLRPLSCRVQVDLSGFSDHRPAIATYPTT